MSDDAELSISELRRKRAQSSAGNPRPDNAAPQPDPVIRPIEPVIIETPLRAAPAPVAAPTPGGPGRRPPAPAKVEEEAGFNFDFVQLIETARANWLKLSLATILVAGLGLALGYWRANYNIRFTLTLRDLSTRIVPAQDTETYRPPQLSKQTLIDFLVSPELLRYVSTKASPAVSEKKLRARLTIDEPEKDTSYVNVTLAGKHRQDLVTLGNLYITAALDKSKESQLENPTLTYLNFSNSLANTMHEEALLEQKLQALRTNNGIVNPVIENESYEKNLIDLRLKILGKKTELQQLNAREGLLRDEPLRQELQAAQEHLKVLQRTLADQNPSVVEARAHIAELTKQLQNSLANTGADSPFLADTAIKKKTLESDLAGLTNEEATAKGTIDRLYSHTDEYNQFKAQFDLLEKYRNKVVALMYAAKAYQDNAEGYYKIPPAIQLEDVDVKSRYVSTISFGVKCAVGGFLLTLGMIVLVENINLHLKTAAEVKRVTKLPVLAALGDLNKMDAGARKAWAFRTWTILSGTLVQSSNRGTVCGIISCLHGEGRTTWVELLVDAARQRGFEVTKLDFRHVSGKMEAGADPPPEPGAAPANAGTGNQAATSSSSSSLATTPANQALSQANAASVIHVQLPGLVWDLERRIQFQEELEKWMAVSRAVILIDLPPASVPEAVLLAENLPQVLWLVDSGKPTARETRLHLETLRHARCKLVGAVLNHEPEPLIKL